MWMVVCVDCEYVWMFVDYLFWWCCCWCVEDYFEVGLVKDFDGFVELVEVEIFWCWFQVGLGEFVNLDLGQVGIGYLLGVCFLDFFWLVFWIVVGVKGMFYEVILKVYLVFCLFFNGGVCRICFVFIWIVQFVYGGCCV